MASRTDGEAIAVTRSASSPAAEKITLSNLPNEELIVLVTGWIEAFVSHFRRNARKCR